jgi:hypothetical protein
VIALLVAALAPVFAADEPYVWVKQGVGSSGWPAGLISDTKAQVRFPMYRNAGLVFRETYAGAGARLEAARAALGDAFRESDILLQARQEERRLAVLLPGAAVQGAQAAAARVRAQIAEWVPSTAGRSLVGVALLHRARVSRA